MIESDKSKEELIDELEKLRKRFVELAKNEILNSEEWFSKFMDSVTDIIVIWDSNMNMIEINKAGIDLMPPGSRKEELIGKHITDLSPDVKESGRYDKYLEVLESGEPYETDDFVIHPDFGDIDFKARAFRLGDKLLMISNDITDRKKTERQLKQHSQYLSLINDIARTVISTMDIGILFSSITKQIKLLIDFDRGSLVQVHKDEKTATVLTLNPEESRKEVTGGAKITLPDEMLRAVREKKGIIRPDLTKSGSPVDQALVKMGIKSCINSPLISQKKVIGIFNIGSSKLDAYSEDDLKLIQSISDLIAPAIERAFIWEALEESEERFRTIAERSFDIICKLDIDGNITYISPSVRRALGYQPENLINRNLKGFIPESEITKIERAGKKILKGIDFEGLELKVYSKNKTIVYFEINANPIFKVRKIVGIQGIARDISERKRAEEEMKKKLMKFRLEEGGLYLVQESSPALSLEAFKDLLKVGYDGMVISRTPGRDLKKMIKGEVEFVWLSEKKGENTLSPMLQRIEKKVESVPYKIIYIDRLDYLISKHGFNNVLQFVQRIREGAIISNRVIILSIDPSTLDERELTLLGKEAVDVELSYKPKLPEHLLDVLKMVYNQNIIGTKPSYTEIGTELHISKPTVRKRIRLLVSAGYINEKLRGRNKVLEMTDRGKSVFTK
ncbi:MAG: PAS domain S-box protein [Thermoplasmata archaeon]|nr:MAG: PAS domain S-box protein [Thermoplasmata archaeon]